MEKLIVKNFGAIKDIEIELKDLTIFIGKSGTGKSTLAKLIAIFRDKNFWENQNFQAQLEKNQITVPYLKSETYIYYESSFLIFEYEQGNSKIDFTKSFLKSLDHSTIEMLFSKNSKNQNNEIEAQIDWNKFIYQSKTIPAERQLTSHVSENYIVLEQENVARSLPKTLIEFAKEWNDISKVMSGTNIPMFDVTYEKGKDGRDYIILPDKTKLLMNVSASGMQTAIPALLVMDYYSKDKDHKRSFVFEEPELNLFPYAQGRLVEFMAEKVLNRGHQLVICTHSPYILTSFNNLLYAHQVQKEYPHSKAQVFEVVSENKIVSSDNIVIYYLPLQEEFEEYETYAVDLLDRETGLIPDNDLDSASEYINDDFKQLITIYREHKRANRK